uniref:CSON006903 protein n=1 Tax=Culicoides sonorensis TaxID=179676 RepID=A0A336LWT4_CULSO
MKFAIVFVAIVSVALAAEVSILRSDSDVGIDKFSFGYETSGGTKHEEQGEVIDPNAEEPAYSVRGSYSFIGDDGVTYTVDYVADQNVALAADVETVRSDSDVGVDKFSFGFETSDGTKHDASAVIIFVALFAFALSNPVEIKDYKFDYPIDLNGAYKFAFESEDGVRRTEEGLVNNPTDDGGALQVKGSFSYVADGVTYTIDYIANEEGFQPTGFVFKKQLVKTEK